MFKVELFYYITGCIIIEMNLEQEKDLVERAGQSPEAFGELYDMYYDRIFGYTLRRCADIEMAKDITSAVFLKALKNIGKFRWRGVPFSHWLYRIANREIIDHHNSIKRETDYDSIADSGNENRHYDEYLDLHRYISRLSRQHQEVISLRYFEDLSIAEIARILKKPEGTVKSALSRGIDRLRRMMESQR